MHREVLEVATKAILPLEKVTKSGRKHLIRNKWTCRCSRTDRWSLTSVPKEVTKPPSAPHSNKTIIYRFKREGFRAIPLRSASYDNHGKKGDSSLIVL